MSWKQELEHYQKGITDEELLEEAIATCESVFELADKDKLLHHSRPLAISYLALLNEKDKKT